MSYITDVLIQGVREREIEPLNKWLDEIDTDRHQQFRPINMDAAGGNKVYTPRVWAASFNYMPVELHEKLRDPATWGTAVLMVAVIIDGEDGTAAFCFDKVDGTYQPVVEQEVRL